MTTGTIRVGMSLEDFVEQYNQQPFELVGGEVIPLSSNVAGHQWVAQTAYDLLKAFTSAHNLGFVAFETPFALSDRPDWVTGSRTPDLMFFRAERWSAYIATTPDWRNKPYLLVPDLVIEVVSPNDRYSEIQDKVDGYLADGVQIAWVFDPQRRKVVIHVADSDQQTTLRENDTLTGGDVLPGFSVPIKSLFE
jgi:Uma2 family endonuclease